MKKVAYAFLILALASSSAAFARGSKPALGPPANVVAQFNCDGSITVTWDSLAGANKYSIEVTVEYNSLSASDCSTTNVTTEFSFDSATNSITIPASAFVVDFGTGNGPQTPCAYDDVCVKGLNPPQPKIGSQNNPFTCVSVTPTVCS